MTFPRPPALLPPANAGEIRRRAEMFYRPTNRFILTGILGPDNGTNYLEDARALAIGRAQRTLRANRSPLLTPAAELVFDFDLERDNTNYARITQAILNAPRRF